MPDLERTDSETESQSMSGHGAQPNGGAGPKPDKVPLWARICCCAGLALVAISVVLTFVMGILEDEGFFPSEMELPMKRVDTIALDKEGNIHCHSSWSTRIQIYGPEGRFIRGFYVDNIRRFSIDANQNVSTSVGSTIFSGAKFRTYNWEGKLLREEPYVDEIHDKIFGIGEDKVLGVDKPEATDAAGNSYRIMPFSSISARVEKITPDGKRSVVVSQPLRLILIKAPFPALFYFFLGFSLFCTYKIAKHFHNKKRKQLR